MPDPRSKGSISIQTCPYWPCPPVCRTSLPSARTARSISEGDSRPADVALDLKFTPHAVGQYLQVQLAHSGDDRLSGFIVVCRLERRVLVGKLGNCFAQLFLVDLGLGLDSHGHHGLRERDRLQHYGVDLGADSVSGNSPPETDGGSDVSDLNRFNLFAAVGMHAHDPTDTLSLALAGIEDHCPAVYAARVHTEIDQPAYERIGHRLEC